MKIIFEDRSESNPFFGTYKDLSLKRKGFVMKPFSEIVNKIKWSNLHMETYTVGYFDRIENKILEMPLADFLNSEIPEHRAWYIKKNRKIIWDRRKL